jgi:hypothetical protein
MRDDVDHFQIHAVSARDLIVTAGPTLLLLAGACRVAYWLVDPAPPEHVILGIG